MLIFVLSGEASHGTNWKNNVALAVYLTSGGIDSYSLKMTYYIWTIGP
jgi:hypothetical protein